MKFHNSRERDMPLRGVYVLMQSL